MTETLSIRDELAARLLAALITGKKDLNFDKVAAKAYDAADALLRERSARSVPSDPVPV